MKLLLGILSRRLICYTPEAIETIAVIEPIASYAGNIKPPCFRCNLFQCEKRKEYSICCLKNLISSNIFNLFGTEKMD
jgi:hypothetical protein